jgi:NitT/TauT family transport system ATP-binding protein
VSAILEFDGVSMAYRARSGRSVPALDGISGSIADGEFVTVLGPSGCGKSTLMKILAQVIPADSGQIRFEGEALRGPTARIGMVFQQPVLMPWRNVIDNVLFPIEMLGRSKVQHRPRAMELLDLVGLSGFESMLPRELSGGMQSRVAICRALVFEPQLLFMDEPFAALDAMTRDELGMELLRIWSERRKTVVFVTHSIAEAILLADRALVMTARPGRIAASVPITLPRPRTLDMVSTPEYGRHAEQLRALVAGRSETP